MKRESPSQTKALQSALIEALQTYCPRSVLIISGISKENHWSHEVLQQATEQGVIQHSKHEEGQLLTEAQYPTMKHIDDFNASVYSPLRRAQREELEEKLGQERARYFSRPVIDEKERSEIKNYDFAIIDDEFFASHTLSELFVSTRYLFITGIKTFQNYPTYSKLLKSKGTSLLHDDHSIGDGFALFENIPNDYLEEIQEEDSIQEEPPETEGSTADRFDYAREGVGVAPIQETLTSIIRESQAKTILELTQKPNSHAALHNALVQGGNEKTVVKEISQSILQNSLSEYGETVDLIVIDAETEDVHLSLEIISHCLEGKARLVIHHPETEKINELSEQIETSPFFTLLSEIDLNSNFLVAFCDSARKEKLAKRIRSRKSHLIIAPPEPDKAFHVYSLVDAIAKSGSATELFVVCEEHCQELFSRIDAVTKIFAYKASDLQDNRNKIKGLVSNLHLLAPDRVVVLTEEENVLSALLTYRFSGDGIPVHNWGEVLGAHTVFSRETLKDFARIADLPKPTFDHPFPRSGWEERWADRFLAQHELTKENTLLLFSKGNYPVHQFLQAISPLLERGEYTLLIVDAEEEQPEVQQLVEHGSVVSINHTLSLGQLAALLNRSRVVIGGESIPFYLSTLLNLPHVLVAGGGALTQNFPQSSRTIVACLPFACFDCESACRFNKSSCLEDLSPEIVRKAITAALEAEQERMKVIFKSDRPLGEGSAEEAHMALFGDAGVDLVPIVSVEPNQ